MAGLYYFVRVAKSESLARFGSSELLVQLVCQDHAKFFESHRERHARQLALVAMVDRHHSAAEDMGYADPKGYFGNLPANFRAADFSAPCGCGAWYWAGA
jgi:hypothetical protein